MYPLNGLRSLFLKALTGSYESTHAIVEEWNKECDEIYNGKKELIAEIYKKTERPTGTWRLETDEEEPNPMFKFVVCSACSEKANTNYTYCPNCGAKMITSIKLRPDKPGDWEPVESPLHTGQHSQ